MGQTEPIFRSFCSQIFADSSLFLGVTALRTRRFSQKTAGNRRFSQKVLGGRLMHHQNVSLQNAPSKRTLLTSLKRSKAGPPQLKRSKKYVLMVHFAVIRFDGASGACQETAGNRRFSLRTPPPKNTARWGRSSVGMVRGWRSPRTEQKWMVATQLQSPRPENAKAGAGGKTAGEAKPHEGTPLRKTVSLPWAPETHYRSIQNYYPRKIIFFPN